MKISSWYGFVHEKYFTDFNKNIQIIMMMMIIIITITIMIKNQEHHIYWFLPNQYQTNLHPVTCFLMCV